MIIRNEIGIGSTGRMVICLFLGLCISGCLFTTPPEGAISLNIIKKEVIPYELGECVYHADMSVTNNGFSSIDPLAIIVEIHDMETGKSAAFTSIDVLNLNPSESRNLSVALTAHCRANYTLRAYAKY